MNIRVSVLVDGDYKLLSKKLGQVLKGQEIILEVPYENRFVHINTFFRNRSALGKLLGDAMKENQWVKILYSSFQNPEDLIVRDYRINGFDGEDDAFPQAYSDLENLYLKGNPFPKDEDPFGVTSPPKPGGGGAPLKGIKWPGEN